jgi:hypothetical protein
VPALLLDNDVETRNDYGMLSSNCSAGSLSTVVRLGALLTLLTVTGCPDTGAKFDEFLARIPDGAPVNNVDAPVLQNIPDVNGTFLMGFKISLLPNPIQLIATVTMTPITATSAELDITLRYLANSDRMFVGDPFTIENVAVSSTGEFATPARTLNVPGQASPTGNNATAENVVLHGIIRSADYVCGTVTGMVTSPISAPLDGSTFGQIRVQAGQTGSQLPQPVSVCTTAPDAGI